LILINSLACFYSLHFFKTTYPF